MKRLATPTRFWLFLLTAALCFVGATIPGFISAQQDPDDAKPAQGSDKPGKPKSQRWRVGFAVDVDGARMRTKPVPVAIAKLSKYKRPAYLPKSGTIPDRWKVHRIKPVETTVWSVKGTITAVAYERDGDYRLHVEDGKGAQVTCVMPDPTRAPMRGRFSKQIDQARAAVVNRFHPTLEVKKVRVPARVDGLGYFGRLNSDQNPSPEGFQLHPVVSVRFLDP